jgi:hypothetical protein
VLDPATVAADTCPLCNQRALSWDGTACTCRSCGSVFEIDPETRRCRYTRVSADYAAAEPALLSDWLTRREVFERVRATRSATPAPTASGAPMPVAVVWAVLVGALLLIPLLCACLSALLLSPGITQTRQMIALAKLPTATVSRTHSISPSASMTTTLTAQALNPLNSPLQSATAGVEPTLENENGAQETLLPAITVEILPSPSENSPVPTATGDGNPAATPTLVFQATATLPATFTPVVAVTLSDQTATPTLSPTPEQTTQPVATVTATLTATATPTTTVVATLTATAEASAGISTTIVISTVMYAGNPAYNQADQYVEVQNRATIAIDLRDWVLKARVSARAYTFPNGFTMQPRQICRIYTNSPPTNYNNCGTLSFYSPLPVWGTSDSAYLYDRTGTLISTYTYTGTTASQ